MEPDDFHDNRYLIKKLLGAGGMGKVYLAEDKVLYRNVAIKVCLSSSAEVRDRFYKEAKAQASLAHPGIVTIHDFSVTGQGPYIVMEYFPGQDLGKRIATTGKIDLLKSIEIVMAVGRALDHAHHRKVIHRDIKPANILIANDDTPKLSDFGLANIPDMPLTAIGQAMGTYGYMSPEQHLNAKDVDERADIFSLGRTFYEMLTGNHTGVDLDAVPLSARPAISAALRPNREDRPKNVEEWLSLLPPSTSDRCGTIEALAVIKHNHWVPATKADHPELKFDLGDRRTSGLGKPRTIIGYAYDPKRRCALYIVKMHEKNQMDGKRAHLANHEYSALLGIDNQVFSALVSKPGVGLP